MGEDAALRTALCTCPIEAAAKGMRSNDSKHSDHDVPNASRRTSYYTELKKKERRATFITHFHLPIRHVMSAVLYSSEDLFNFRREHMTIFQSEVIQSCIGTAPLHRL